MLVLAERAGFEPAVRLSPYTRFPGVRLKPLIHLSGGAYFNKSPDGGGWRKGRDCARASFFVPRDERQIGPFDRAELSRFIRLQSLLHRLLDLVDDLGI